MRPVSCVAIGCSVLLSGALSSSASAQRIVSVDVLSDTLVRIDLQSGSVLPIGALGVDVEMADLATFDGELFMVTNTGAGSDTKLYRVSPNTGAATFCCDISSDSNGRTVQFGEALTSDDVGLILGYDARVDENAISFGYGRIEDGGGVQNVTNLSGCADLCDSDGAGYDPLLGVVFTVDGVEDDGRSDWGVFELSDGEIFNTDSVDEVTAMGLVNDVVVDNDLAFGVTNAPGESGALLVFSRDGSAWDLTGVTRIVGADQVVLNGVAVAAQNDCGADIDGDGDADASDFFGYLDLFAAGDARADTDRDGDIDAEDFFGYLDLFAAGC